MVSTTAYGDDDLDDADCDLGFTEGEVLDLTSCALLAVSVLVPVLVVDGLVVDGLILSSTVEAFGALVFDLAEASFGAKLNGIGVGAVPTEGRALIMFHLLCRLPRFFVPLLKFLYKHLILVYGSFAKICVTELWSNYSSCYKRNEFLGRK